MADTRLPLEVNARPLDTATPITNMGNQQYQNTMNEEQILKAHYEGLDTRERSRLSSTIAAAAQLKPYLDSGDLDGAHEFLMRRKTQLQNRIGSGEAVDTQETDAALEMIRKGDLEGLKNGVHGLMAAGQVYGILSNKDMPSNVQEWQYYNSLPADKQQEYLTMKRANPAINLGGTQMIPNPINPAGAPLASYPVTPKPEDMPDFKGEQARSQAAGTAAGERDATRVKSEFDAKANANYIREALKVLPQATGGLASQGAKAVAGAVGISTDASKADRKLAILAAKLTGSVPRFEGPQGVLDVKLYQEAAGDLANTNLPTGDREAAAQLMLDLLDEYGPTGTGSSQQNNFTTYGQPSSEKITVTDGKETFEIDPADLPAAQAEGFKKI